MMVPMIVKVCGITNAEDAELACAAGATAIGFNFYALSPRYIVPELAAAIRTPPGVRRVGVFVNEARETVERIARAAALDVAQLHGDETPADYPAGLAVWKATRVAGPLNALPFLNCPIEALLLDGPAGAKYGGSGKSFQWRLAAYSPMRVILAGGLDASNVAQAIAAARPWGVDACSRIESAPGRKDPVKMTAFLAAAWEAFRA
ncbi:MAG: phosphoribosylanthranilate isomerase [Bryobacteraceae bacterium]